MNMNSNLRTGIVAISLFIILLISILLIRAPGVSAQYSDNVSLSVDKATYALGETVCITLTAAQEEIVFFNIISPTGIIYTAIPSTDREYKFKPDIAGTYVVNVLLRTGDDEKFLTAGFGVTDPKIVFGEPEQGEIELGEPVNWSQHISITNHERFSISNFPVSIPLPTGHSNLSSDAGFTIIDSSIPVDLAAGEDASFNISYQTPPVRLAVTEESISISDLIPPDAFDIGVYREIGTDEGGPGLTDEITVKQVKVWHNSSMHYHDIPVAIEARGFDEIVEFVDDARIVAEMTTERSNETLSWTIPKLSDRTYAVVEVTREQGDAEIGEPVEWQLDVSGTIVRYKTPAPYKSETEPVIAEGTWKKEIVIGSNASMHYSDVTAYSKLGDIEKSNLRLFWLVNGSRIDVTDSEEFGVSFTDTNGNGILDKVTWNVPQLSNQSFEIEADITVINVQSYPTVGGNWGVEFRTVGCANLTITAVDGTTWSNADEEGDLQFLEIKCGDQTLNYEWINDSVFIEDYSCNLTGHEVSKVLTPGTHTLQFRFGSDTEYAHNWATDLSDWDHRQNISISNTAGNLSYYQVKIELNSLNIGTNWNWSNNGNDIRFTYYNSSSETETEIPFWIESWNSTAETSTIRVNVTYLENNTDTTIYLYYGNPSAPSTSNGTNTFEFFDDFESFNLDDWEKEYSGSTLSQVSDPAISGRGHVLKYDGNGWYAFKKTTYTFTNGTIHFEFYRPSSNAMIQFCWRIASISPTKNLYEFVEKKQVLKFQKLVNNKEYKNIDKESITCPANTWHNSKIVANGSSIEYWVDGTEHLSFSDNSFSSGNLGGICKYDLYLNDIFICKYASPEPTVTIGSEEAKETKYTEFNGSQSTDFNNVTDMTNVSNATLQTNTAKITWCNNVNAYGADFDTNTEFGFAFVNVNSTGLNSTFNSSATITFYNLPWNGTPTIFKDGFPCQDCRLNFYSGGNLSFNIIHFSNYSAGVNANLSIWDDTDPEGGGQTKYIDEQIKFYANYTNITSGEPINGSGVYCNISFNVTPNGPFNMTFNSTSGLYEYNRSFSSLGTFNWNVTANGSALGHEVLNVTDQVITYAGYKPDLRVINVTFDHWDTAENRSSISETGTGYHVKENKNITINATIANYADGNVTSNFDVSFFDSAGVYGNWSRCFWNSMYNVSTEGELGGVIIGYPHNTTYVTGYWNPSLVGTHNISVWADPANSASESAANTTNNNGSALINVSAWQKYWGNLSGSIVLADSAASSLYDWTWSNETDAGYAYIVNDGASVNWSALHALGCDSDDTLNTSGQDFLDADTNLAMIVGSSNATGFADNTITELFSGGDPSNATNRTHFIVHGTNIADVPVVNSTDMTDHTSVESANFITGILWDDTKDTNGYYDATENEDLVFIANIRAAAFGLGSAVHNYEVAAPCALNPAVGGDLDIYMELK